MTQRDLERQIARATGESMSTIRKLGFNLIEMPEREPLTVDWDKVDESRVAVFPQRQREHTAA